MANRKLFLSWMALRNALAEGKVLESDLNVCLVCTSMGELILGEALYRRQFAGLVKHLVQAAREGRLVYYDNIDAVNGITIDEVNGLLSRNGEGSLDCAGRGSLSTVLASTGVPKIDGSQTEVLWADQPSAQQMQEARRLQNAEYLTMATEGRKPEDCSNWILDLRQALAAAACR
ncbi:MAG TPA: hypothetical protein PKZ32_00745 [Candidatus Melainabacteria bacterium]|nr:hypothetical protein [Candidatus Melainabacteria bacterium]